jgi:hypothetical protein
LVTLRVVVDREDMLRQKVKTTSIKGVADIAARFCHTEFMEASPMKPDMAQVGSKKIGLVGGLVTAANSRAVTICMWCSIDRKIKTRNTRIRS